MFSSGCGAAGRPRRGLGLRRRLCARRDGELVEARVAATAAGDERDVQLVVQILAPQERRRPGDARCRQGSADKLPARHRARRVCLVAFFMAFSHNSAQLVGRNHTAENKERAIGQSAALEVAMFSACAADSSSRRSPSLP